jgi:hypothetical protein
MNTNGFIHIHEYAHNQAGAHCISCSTRLKSGKVLCAASRTGAVICRKHATDWRQAKMRRGRCSEIRSADHHTYLCACMYAC